MERAGRAKVGLWGDWGECLLSPNGWGSGEAGKEEKEVMWHAWFSGYRPQQTVHVKMYRCTARCVVLMLQRLTATV